MTQLLTFPYRYDLVPLEFNTRILDEMVAHPQFFSVPQSPEQARVTTAAYLTAPDSLPFAVVRGTEYLGILLLSRVVPQMDALFHFLFLDGNLVGKRQLLRRFLTHALSPDGLGFRRISTEVPEDADKLLRFYIKLGFRFEGEQRASGLAPTAFLEEGAPGLSPIPNAAAWIAKHGSRVEDTFWRHDRWIDVLRLRVTRATWGREEPAHASRPNSSSRRTGRRGIDRQGDRSQTKQDHRPTSSRSRPKPR